VITEHAPLAPSSAPQWGKCSGSVVANRDAPDRSCERTEGGTASHWVAEELFEAGHSGAGVLPETWLGSVAPNGVVIDEEMIEGAAMYYDDVIRILNEVEDPAGEQLFIEKRVHMPHIHPDNWGTLDSALWVPTVDTLYLWDYKFGHREVDAVLNLQLIDYVAGIMQECPLMNTSTKVVMRVVQPFCYHAPEPIREWVTTVKDLQFWWRKLAEKAKQAMGDNPLMASGVHCRDCAAVARCRTARRTGYSVIQYANEPYEINALDGGDLAAERHILDTGLRIVKARLEAIDDQLFANIASGDISSGLTIKAGQGRLGWSAPAPVVLALGAQFGADLSKDAVVTPTQAVKLVPSEMRSAFRQATPSITSRPSTGLKLIPADDSVAARAFKSKE
jgi:hypothetical protein